MCCCGYALWRYFGPKRAKYLIVRRSAYIPFVHHMMTADDLGNATIEEAIPVGPKKHGWRGVLHALTERWVVRRGRDE
jgi:hypothetical protein